jgi:hypothetical protein
MQLQRLLAPSDLVMDEGFALVFLFIFQHWLVIAENSDKKGLNAALNAVFNYFDAIV